MKPVPLTLARPSAVGPNALPRAGPIVGSAPAGWPIALFGVAFDNLDRDELEARIDALIASRRPAYVTAADLGTIALAQRRADIREALATADGVIATSRTIARLARWLGNTLRDPLVPHDFTHRVVRLCAARGYRAYVLTSGSAAAHPLLTREPGFTIAGQGSIPSDSAPFTDDALATANPDLVLVCPGTEQDEAWLAGQARRFGPRLCIRLPPLASPATARPRWSAWRRWRQLSAIAPSLLRLCRPRWHRGTGTATGSFHPETSGTVVDAGEALTRAAFGQQAGAWQALAENASDTILDLSHVRRVDPTGIAFLACCQVRRKHLGRQLVLLAPSPAIRAALDATMFRGRFAFASSPADARTLIGCHPAGSSCTPGTTRSLAWCGEIVAANVEDVWQMTSEYLRTFAATGATLVIIDLTRLRSIDVAGAALMLQLRRIAQTLHLAVLFAHPIPEVRRVLNLSRLESLLLEAAQ